MKKKILSFMLALGMIVPCLFGLTACQTTCEMETEWSYDETYHWHACKSNICKEVADKAQHEWDNGKVTTLAENGETGEKTYTCKQCSATKTEEVRLTVTSGWENAFSLHGVDNMQYITMGIGIGTLIYQKSGNVIRIWQTEEIIEYSLQTVGASTYAYNNAREYYYTIEDGVYYEYYNDGRGWYKNEIYGSEYNEVLPQNFYCGQYYANLNMNEFTFNPETERYENWIDEPEYEQYTAIAFKDGKVSEVYWMDGNYIANHEIFTYSNVKITVPEEFSLGGPET